MFRKRIESSLSGVSQDEAKQISSMISWAINIILIIVFFTILNPLYIISSGSKGLSFKFGAVQETEIEPGIHFRIPFIEKIKTFSIQPQQIDYTVPVGADGAITSDNQTIGASASVFFRYRQGQLVKVYRDYGVDTLKNIITTTIKDSIKAVMGSYTIFDIASNQNKITTSVTADIKDKLKDYPIEITELKITNYNWSDDFDTQIQATMQKKQQVLAKEQEVLIAKSEADKLVNQAEAERKALVTKAEGEKTAAVTKAEGERDAAKLKAEAKALEGEGIKKYNQSIAVNLDVELKLKQLDIEMKKAEKWNGEYVSTNNYGPIPVSTSSLLGK